MSMAK